MDKFEAAIFGAQAPCAILTNARADFELLPLDAEPVTEQQRDELQARGLRFIGSLGMVGGIPRVALAEPLNATALATICQAFLLHLDLRERDAHNVQTRTGDAVSWLEDLYRLEDSRPED